MKFLTALIILISINTQAQSLRCRDLFNGKPMEFVKTIVSEQDAKLIYKSAEQQKNSTTGARYESKLTLLTDTFVKLLHEFDSNLKNSAFKVVMVLRDKVVEGRRNLTMTMYYNLFSTSAGETIKLRARKYGETDVAKEISNLNINLIPLTQDHSFLEYKMDIPSKPTAVYKPRVLVADKYIKMIGTAEFLNNYNEALRATLSTNAKTHTTGSEQTIHDMFKALAALHAGRYELKPLLYTVYERFSYSVKFTQTLNGVEHTFDVQLTDDRSIHGTNLSKNLQLEAYPEKNSVFEWKIPVEIAEQNQAQVEATTPGYSLLNEFLAKVDQSHDPRYEKNKGKMYHFRVTEPDEN